MTPKVFDLLIRNGLIVTEERIFKGDIGVCNGKFAEISEKIGADASAETEIDATGMHILPGVIDSHVHADDPGRTEWETFAHVTRSLAAGGVTSFFDMPLNSIPYTNDALAFKAKKEVADQKCVIDYALLGGVTPDNLEYIKELKASGAIGFKGFLCFSGIAEYGYLDDEDLFSAMEKIAEVNSVLMLHAENATITTRLSRKAQLENRLSIRDYVSTRPVACEITSVQKALSMAEVTKCKTHIVHVSSGEVADVVTRAKARGTDVTVETCPQYLSLTVDDFERIGMLGKCAPPLRDAHHVESLWECIKNGEIDTVGSDHSPSPPEAKLLIDGKNIFTIFGGMSMAQSTLNVMLEEGYFKRNIPLETIVKVTSANPARRFGLYPQKGSIDIGSDADFVLVDLNDSFTLQKEDLYYLHQQSPFAGKIFRGKIKTTAVRGHIVYDQGQFKEDFRGKMI